MCDAIIAPIYTSLSKYFGREAHRSIFRIWLFASARSKSIRFRARQMMMLKCCRRNRITERARNSIITFFAVSIRRGKEKFRQIWLAMRSDVKEDEKWFIVRVMQRQTRKLLWWAHPDKSELFAALLLLSRRCCDCLLEWKPHEHDACLCNQRAICASRTPESNVITDEFFSPEIYFRFDKARAEKKKAKLCQFTFSPPSGRNSTQHDFFSLFGIVEIVL